MGLLRRDEIIEPRERHGVAAVAIAFLEPRQRAEARPRQVLVELDASGRLPERDIVCARARESTGKPAALPRRRFEARVLPERCVRAHRMQHRTDVSADVEAGRVGAQVLREHELDQPRLVAHVAELGVPQPPALEIRHRMRAAKGSSGVPTTQCFRLSHRHTRETAPLTTAIGRNAHLLLAAKRVAKLRAPQ